MKNKANENKVLSHCEALRCETITEQQKRLFSFTLNLHTYHHFRLDFPNVDKHTGGTAPNATRTVAKPRTPL